MTRLALASLALLASVTSAIAGPASGTVKSATGTITVKQAIAYTVRDSRNPRSWRTEVLLTDVPVDAASLRGDLDPHVRAINFEALKDRNYLLLWVTPEGAVMMNATYSKTMTQYMADTSGGLKGEFTTNTAARVEGRVFSTSPLKTMDGPTYTIDVKFSADVIPPLTGTALPAGGGDPGKAFTAFIGAIAKKNWNGIKAGLSPTTLPSFEKDYNTPAENLSSAVDILKAWLPLDKAKVTGGALVSDTDAVLEMEGERFGSRQLTLVRMTKTGAVWQFRESVTAGMLR
ncbi:MAG: hypothetical protein U0P30_05390 [Vicinamibacterales bacterium]